ncbi:hypothetical protein GGF46_003080 [Coemansia sp. RSA 552]|nr:hypothetical protein GGF46_003080 [Coemansia sp. RSA 552]
MVLRSDDVNYLVYRYLRESGFMHSSYIFQFESQIHKTDDGDLPNVEPGSLIRVLQKGLQYMDVETHLNEDGTARLCTAPFSLVGKHVCSVQPTEAGTVRAAAGGGRGNGTGVHGGHTLVHDAKDARKASKDRYSAMVEEDEEEEPNDGMDVDVPDAEKESRRGQELARQRKLGRLVEPAQLLHGHTSPVFLCAWNPATPAVLATGAGDGTARIWDLSQRQSTEDGAGDSLVLRHDEGLSGADERVDVTSIAWNEQGTTLATASFSGELRAWTTAGEPKLALRQRQAPIIAMRWNRKGSLLATAYLDGNVGVWDMQAGQLRRELKAHSGCVMDVDWLDNTTFASCGNDKAIRVWREGESAPVRTFTGHKSDINAIKWHPGGKYLASASDDGTVKVWSMSGPSDGPVHDFFGHSQQVYLAKWLPRTDKFVLASASFDGTVRVWDLQSNACLRVLAAHTKPVDCLAFSSDGRYLASGSFDRKVCIWLIKDGSLFKTYMADDAVHDVQWASKGRIAVAVASSNVAVFDPFAA